MSDFVCFFDLCVIVIITSQTDL